MQQKSQNSKMFSCTHIFQAACGKNGTSDKQAGLCISTYPSFFSKHQKNNAHGYKTVAVKIKEEDHTTRLSHHFFPVSIKYETINGHTPTSLARKSVSSGLPRLQLKMASLSAGREAIASRLSAPLSLFAMNFVME